MKVLYITRKFPPSVGGMQKVSYHLVNSIQKFVGIDVISLGKSQVYLPYFLKKALIKGLMNGRKYDIIHLGDALLAPIGVILKKVLKKPVVVTVHGLDVTYENKLYQRIIPNSLKKLDKIIAVSNATIEECVKKGISREKCVFIPNGIDSDEDFINADKNILKRKLSDEIKIDLKDKKILLTVGRLVKRKGVYWFIDNVLDKLDNVVYLVSGDGVEKEKINELIKRKKVTNVHLLGRTSDKVKKLLYNASDVFVMPNIKVEGDLEGFGIVIIEGGSCNLISVGANIEGIKDAIQDGKNGFLARSGDANDFVLKIEKALKSKLNVRDFTIKNYNWENISKKTFEEYGKLVRD